VQCNPSDELVILDGAFEERLQGRSNIGLGGLRDGRRSTGNGENGAQDEDGETRMM
jgi:hypothetical protein